MARNPSGKPQPFLSFLRCLFCTPTVLSGLLHPVWTLQCKRENRGGEKGRVNRTGIGRKTKWNNREPNGTEERRECAGAHQRDVVSVAWV